MAQGRSTEVISMIKRSQTSRLLVKKSLSLQFMESVETVLQKYGGPKEAWLDTFGVPRALEEFTTNTFETVSFNAPRSALLETDKSVRFVLQVTILSRGPALGQIVFSCMHTVDYAGFAPPQFRGAT